MLLLYRHLFDLRILYPFSDRSTRLNLLLQSQILCTVMIYQTLAVQLLLVLLLLSCWPMSHASHIVRIPPINCLLLILSRRKIRPLRRGLLHFVPA